MLHIADASKSGPRFEHGRLKLLYNEMIRSCEILNVEIKLATYGRISYVLHVPRAYVELVAIVPEVRVYYHVYIDLYSAYI